MKFSIALFFAGMACAQSAGNLPLSYPAVYPLMAQIAPTEQPGPTQTVASGKLRAGAPRIFIQPQDGFESYIAAAIVKKHVPAVVTADKEQADFVLTSVVLAKTETTGGKIARCLFMYCIGVEGTQTATVQLINAQGDVAWAYNVHKGAASAYQSTAEAIAKHLKGFLEAHPQ